jgi:predicted glutamine amidotransferase
MCRILFSLSVVNNPTNLIKEFLKKSEEDDIIDGFGINWYDEAKHCWKTMKMPEHFTCDPTIFKKIDKINLTSRLVLAHSRAIDKDNLTPSQIKKEKSFYNTHPISYDGNFLMQHGDLLYATPSNLTSYQVNRHLPEFKQNMNKIIDASQILSKGSTDTEIILNLFSSIKRNLSRTSKNMENIMIDSFLQTIRIIQQNNIINRSNILLASGDYVILAKINLNHSKFKRRDLDFFIDISTNSIMASTYKLTPSAKQMKNNTAFIVNHKLNIMKQFDII